MNAFKIIIVLNCFNLFTCYSQDIKSPQAFGIGLNLLTPGKYDVASFYAEDGDPTFSSKSFYAGGLSMMFGIQEDTKHVFWSFETGLTYSNHQLYLHPTSADHVYPEKERIELFTIPLNIRLEFAKYFYVSPGFLLDFQLNDPSYITNQSGLGLNASLGFRYNFKSGFGMYAGPEGKIHSLIPFSGDKLMGIGFKMGIMLY